MKVEYSEALLALAENWGTYQGDLVDPHGKTWPVTRCSGCDAAILHEPGSLAGTAYHLLTHHGYKMDGRHEDDLRLAAREAAERGEMNEVIECP